MSNIKELIGDIERPISVFSQQNISWDNLSDLPTTKNENYQKIDIKSIFEKSFATSKLNFENSVYDNSKDGVVVMDIVSFAKQHKDILDKYLFGTTSQNAVEEARGTKFRNRSSHRSTVVDLNTLFVSCGTVVYVPKNTSSKEHIKINIKNSDITLGRRDLIIVEDFSKANILVSYESQHTLLNRVCEVYLGESSKLELVEELLSSTSKNTISSTIVEQKKASEFVHFSINSTSSVLRSNIKINMQGEGADCKLFGANLAKDNSTISTNTVVEHLVANCTSDEHYKNISADNAVCDFAGTIFVNDDAQKTSALQRNDNIILSNSAKAYTKPQLEIYADDVKCNHGSTVGQLNELAMFYMMQRGISQIEAKKLLLTGFLNDILMRISDENIREEISEKMNNAVLTAE